MTRNYHHTTKSHQNENYKIMKSQRRRMNVFAMMAAMVSALVVSGMSENKAMARARHITVMNGGNGEYHCSPSKRKSYAAQNRAAKRRRRSR